jgi:hypothetical protein
MQNPRQRPKTTPYYIPACRARSFNKPRDEDGMLTIAGRQFASQYQYTKYRHFLKHGLEEGVHFILADGKVVAIEEVVEI